MKMRSVIPWAVVVLLAAPAWGQVTRAPERSVGAAAVGAAPAAANQAWSRTVEAFAKSLASGDLTATESALTPRAVVRRFEMARGAETWRLAERAVKSTIIGQHAYVHPPLVMAADIAADFKNAAGVPDKSKAQYIVDDESEIKRANTTAVNWVVEQLNVGAGTPVGVIVLWTPRPLPPGAKESQSTAVFDVMWVLCRGEETVGHKFRINTVVYGSPTGDGK
jgi:hypothetical protein